MRCYVLLSYQRKNIAWLSVSFFFWSAVSVCAGETRSSHGRQISTISLSLLLCHESVNGDGTPNGVYAHFGISNRYIEQYFSVFFPRRSTFFLRLSRSFNSICVFHLQFVSSSSRADCALFSIPFYGQTDTGVLYPIHES